MKNIHLLPTKNYKQDYTLRNGEVVEVIRLGQLILNRETSELSVNKNPQWAASCDTDVLVPQHLYITSDEEIKEGDWFIHPDSSCFDKECKEVSIGGYEILQVIKVDENFIYHSAMMAIHKNLNIKKIILTTDQDLITDGVQAIDDEFLEWFVKNPSCESVEIQCRYNFYAGQDLTHYKTIIPRNPKPLATNYMKTYTEEEVTELIHDVVLETAKGVRDWFEKETVITDNETGDLLTNATIGLKENPANPLKNYIYPRLERFGIKYNTELRDILGL